MTLVRQLDSLSHAVCEDALDEEGYVLQEGTIAGQVKKCAADGIVKAVGYKSTKNYVTGTAEANKEVAMIRIGEAKVQYNLANTDPDIVIGDLVAMKDANAAGQVKKFVPTAVPASYAQADFQSILDELRTVVGEAQEAIAAPGSGNLTGTMKVWVTVPANIMRT